MSRRFMAMHCQSKLQLYAKWSCISGALWVAVPGNQHPGGRSTLLPCKGLQCYTAQTENFEVFFSQGSNLCLAWGSTGHFPLSSPTKHLLESETTGWFSGVKSVSWCAFGVSSGFQNLQTEALPGAYDKVADQPLIPNNLGEMVRYVQW